MPMATAWPRPRPSSLRASSGRTGWRCAPVIFYVADVERVWRIPYEPGDTVARATAEAVTADGALGASSGHWTRNIVFALDGTRFYVAIGSRGNIGEEAALRASVQSFAADGSDRRSFATGLRNPVGIAFRPGTEDLYVVVNERDGLVPDYLTRVEDSGFYGWPYSYIGSHPQPGLEGKRPDLIARATVPDLLFESHSAPLGLVFYQGDQFPGGLPWRCLRRPSRLLERSAADRLQDRARALRGRPFDRRLREFSDRLLVRRNGAGHGLGPARGPCRGQGRGIAHCRRHFQHGLAHQLRTVIGAAGAGCGRLASVLASIPVC
jgi:hypothetical protein